MSKLFLCSSTRSISTQTVENFFHYSFLVKKGVATLSVREDKNVEGFHLPGGPVAKYVTNVEKYRQPRQAAVNLSMQDWRDLIEAYQIEDSDVPHRTGSKHARLTPTKVVADDSTPSDQDNGYSRIRGD
jgi:non-structural maintenance of chromosomes element 4